MVAGDRTTKSSGKPAEMRLRIREACSAAGPACGMTTKRSTSESRCGFPAACERISGCMRTEKNDACRRKLVDDPLHVVSNLLGRDHSLNLGKACNRSRVETALTNHPRKAGNDYGTALYPNGEQAGMIKKGDAALFAFRRRAGFSLWRSAAEPPHRPGVVKKVTATKAG